MGTMRTFSLLRFLVAEVWWFAIWRGGGVWAQSTATWLFPLEDGLTINTVDEIFLQWTSNYANAWLNMWCQNGTAGNNVVLGSQFQVDSIGRYGYVMAEDFPGQKAFPVACHAQLAVEANGAGLDGPVGITWTSQVARAAKTFSLSATTAGSISPVTTTFSPNATPTVGLVSVSSSNSNVPLPTGSANSNVPPPTGSASSRVQPSSGSAGSSSSVSAPPTSSSPSPTSPPNESASPGAKKGANSSTSSNAPSSSNVGAVVGGVIGGLALLCFIIFGAIFLRKYQRKDEPQLPKRAPSHSWWRRTYRTTEMQTGGLHEKDGDVILAKLEKDGNELHEAVGDVPIRHEKEASFVKSRRYTPIELPT